MRLCPAAGMVTTQGQKAKSCHLRCGHALRWAWRKRPCHALASSSIVCGMRTLLALSVAALVLLKGSTTWAVEPADQNAKAAFAGIESLFVIVDFARNDKLTMKREEVVAATELELRKNGITVTSEFSSDYIYVMVNSFPIEQVDGIALYVHVALCSVVTRSNGTKVFGAETWNSGSLAISKASTASATLREALQRGLVNFCNLYLAANPKGDR